MDGNITQIHFNGDFMEVYFLRDPPYIHVYDFEKLDINYWRKFIGRNWTWSFYVSFAYLGFLYFGQKYMKNRRAFDLQVPLTLWNLALAIFSIIGFSRIAPEIWFLLNSPENGFYKSVCSGDSHSQPTSFFGLLFALILRKKRVIFLHWYHHLTVLNCCWYGFEWYESTFRYFSSINYLIHSAMYTYYALMSAGFHLPKGLAKIVTSLQILQMLSAIFITFYSLWMKYIGAACLVSSKSISLALLMYASYTVLFANYYFYNYLRQNNKNAKTRSYKTEEMKEKSS